MFHRNLTGMDLHEPTNILVENPGANDLDKLRVVILDGMGTSRPKVAADNVPGGKPFGIVSCDIKSGKTGYVTAFGLLYNANTSAWAEKALLYSDANGNLTTVISGVPVAVVVKSDANFGIIFVIALGSYIDPEVSAWGLAGNVGTDDTINYIGTNDLQAFVIKTNAALAAKFDAAGRFGLGPDITSVLAHFHQKSHLGFAGSGIQQETYALETTSDTFQSAYTVTLPDPCVARIEFVVVGRSADGTERTMFKRTGLFYREGGNVEIQGIWLSDQTIKSNSNLDVGYTTGIATLSLNVKAHSPDLMYWTGHVIVEVLSGN